MATTPTKRPPDNGVPIKPKTRPLQFKRGTARAFEQANPVLLYGEPSYEKDTHKMKVGDGATDYKQLPYIGDHSDAKDGKSAYEIWLDQGHTGTVDDFLEWLIGDPGASAYELWLSVGHEGTITDFLIDIQGDSAYQVWLNEGHTGTVTDFLDSLVGKSAYEIWLDLGHQGSEEDFIKSLEGKSAYQVWLDMGYTGTEEDFMAYLSTTTWVQLD